MPANQRIEITQDVAALSTFGELPDGAPFTLGAGQALHVKLSRMGPDGTNAANLSAGEAAVIEDDAPITRMSLKIKVRRD